MKSAYASDKSWPVTLLFDTHPEILDNSFSYFDPSAETNYIKETIISRTSNPTIYTNSRDKSISSNLHLDPTYKRSWDTAFPNVDWIISRPQFTSAHHIIRNAKEHFTRGLAFLVKLSFLEPTFEKQELLSEFPPTHLIILPRLTFFDDEKVDSITYAWFIWSAQLSDTNKIVVVRK